MMFKKMLFCGFVMLACAALLVGCSCSGNTTGRVLEPTSGTQAPVPTGATQVNDKNFMIDVESNPSTGYSWVATYTNEDTVQAVTEKYIDTNSEGIVGGGGITRFEYAGLKPGTVDVTLTFCQPWKVTDVNAKYQRVYHLSVSDDLTVTCLGVDNQDTSITMFPSTTAPSEVTAAQ